MNLTSGQPARRVVFVLLLVLGNLPMSVAVVTQHYLKWYPAYGYILDDAVQTNCKLAFDEYIAGSSPECAPNGPTCLSNRVVSCALDNVTEGLKSNMAAASVVLGLLPSVMGLTASDLTEMGILAQNRPLLTILLTLGAPVLSPIRTFEFINPMHTLQDADQAMPLPEISGSMAMAISLLQYFIAAGAAANILHLSWELGVQAVCSFSPDSIFLPLLWTLIALLIHAFGTWAVRLRLKLHDTSNEPSSLKRRSLWRWISSEGQLCMWQASREAEPQPKSYSFIFCLWFTSIGIILHLVFGTLVLSSTLFLSTTDALLLAARFLISMIACRAIVTFEMNGIKMNLSKGKWKEIVHTRNENVPSFVMG